MRFAIVDVANLFFRARHAVRGDSFTKAGMALHIVFRSLRKLYRDNKVDHMVFATEGKSWRYDVFPQYKAKRKLDRLAMNAREKEEDEVFMETLDNFVNFLAEKTRCTVLHSQGVEGDDFVARWIQLHPADEHIILSGDSDFIQLLAPNVSIYDGMTERMITVDGVFNTKGDSLVFQVNPSNGKLKVAGTVDEERKKHTKAQKAAGTNEPFSFAVEPEWWKKALFIKIIRGDDGDGVFSAYPGVRYQGSSKKVGIAEAWADRKEQGFHWNNFMLQSWSKALGAGPDGTTLTETVRVKDEFAFNEVLIDLTKQPDHVKDLMDRVILDSVQKDAVNHVGVHFMKFCKAHDLPALSKEADTHAPYLSKPYAQDAA